MRLILENKQIQLEEEIKNKEENEKILVCPMLILQFFFFFFLHSLTGDFNSGTSFQNLTY